MAGLTANGKNALLAGLKSSVTHISLHSADPGMDGTSEITGGTPAYARQAVTFGDPSAGAMATTASMTFNVPASATVAYVGYWSAPTGGTFLGSRALDASQTFATAGTFTVNIGDLTEAIG